jgi:hypothetical protein
MAKRNLIFLLLPMLASAAGPSVEIRDSEVWLIRGGQENQLTHDGKAKQEALLSPNYDRIAYDEQCPEAEHCTPSIVILDLAGLRLQSFQPELGSVSPDSPCASILSFSWVSDTAIASECHINPSLSEYVVTEISTGRTRLDLLGYDFTPSPDGKLVAHVGWIVHFAPPYAQSNYLQIGDTTIYPQANGVADRAPQSNGTYTGIHDFLPGFHWSPDSRHIAFIDCTYDWTPNSPESLSAGDGRESNRACALAVIATDGKASLFPITGLSPNDLRAARLEWAGPHKIVFNTLQYRVH